MVTATDVQILEPYKGRENGDPQKGKSRVCARFNATFVMPTGDAAIQLLKRHLGMFIGYLEIAVSVIKIPEDAKGGRDSIWNQMLIRCARVQGRCNSRERPRPSVQL